jgi:hypothetical protein
MHPNPVTSSRGRRKATANPAAVSVPFCAADHLRNAREITGYIQAMLADCDALAVPIALRTVADALGAFDVPAAQCDADTGPRLPAGLAAPSIVYLLYRDLCARLK